MENAQSHDFIFVNHGSVTLLTPVSEAASEWVSEHLPDSCIMFGGGIAIESRYAGPVLEGIINDGLTVQ